MFICPSSNHHYKITNLHIKYYWVTLIASVATFLDLLWVFLHVTLFNNPPTIHGRHGAIHHVRQALRPAVVPGHGLPFVRLPQREGGRGAAGASESASEVGRQLDVFVEPTQGTQALWDSPDTSRHCHGWPWLSMVGICLKKIWWMLIY